MRLIELRLVGSCGLAIRHNCPLRTGNGVNDLSRLRAQQRGPKGPDDTGDRCQHRADRLRIVADESYGDEQHCQDSTEPGDVNEEWAGR